MLALLLGGCGAPASEDASSSEAVSSSADASASAGETEDADGLTAQEASDADASGVHLSKDVERYLSTLTIEQKVAQLFIITPEALTGVGEVVQAGDATKGAIEEHPVGGIILFSQNLIDPGQTKEMLSNIQGFSYDAVGLPMLCAIDEEGGTVARVASDPAFGVEDVGDARSIGETGDVRKAADAAGTIAAYLKELGFNLDFAPDADIVIDPATDSLGTRSFGSDPDLVGGMVASEVRAFGEAGVLSTAKHFPGIGGTGGTDSHVESITSTKTLEELEQCELVPFQEAIAAGVDFVMVGHLLLPNVTDDDLPASLDPVVIGYLRETMGYDGVIITDSLSMEAAQVYAPDEIGVRVIEAGADMILMPEDFEAAYQGVLDAIESGELSEERMDESLRRVLNAKVRLMD